MQQVCASFCKFCKLLQFFATCAHGLHAFILFYKHDMVYYSAHGRDEKYCDGYVCLSVCPLAYSKTTQLNFATFLCMLPMAVARSCSGGVGIGYAFPVLRMTSCFHITVPMAHPVHFKRRHHKNRSYCISSDSSMQNTGLGTRGTETRAPGTALLGHAGLGHAVPGVRVPVPRVPSPVFCILLPTEFSQQQRSARTHRGLRNGGEVCYLRLTCF